jgi:hypothetical protein
VKEDIDRHYPKLADAGYQITSEETPIYNCIAWAVGDPTRWWECGEDGPIDEPGVYWPEGARYGFGLEALISAYELIGYELCPKVGPSLKRDTTRLPSPQRTASGGTRRSCWRMAGGPASWATWKM